MNATSFARTSLLNQWWALIVRGVLAILFGIAAITWPRVTLVALLALFAAFAIADGITSLIAAVRTRSWGWVFFGGLLSLAVGVLTLMWPGAATLALVLLIGAWAIVRGIFDIATGIALRREIRYEWLLILTGVVSIVFGAVIALFPVAGVFALIGIVAGFAIAIGVLLIAAGIMERRLQRRLGLDGATAPAV
ncbi:MAG: DUF308 domain-containing protein [Steroidobacteraceae bacterium]|nr:DUF308 domain-containing protein [Steroidobacteraceae bacterium]